MLFSAAGESMLIGVLANWEPGPDWPGLARQVPCLAGAARALPRAGLIEACQQHLAPREASFLTGPEAVAVLSDRSSWWRDEEAGEDDDVAAADLHGEVADMFCVLVVTGDGAAVVHARGDDDSYGFLQHQPRLGSVRGQLPARRL